MKSNRKGLFDCAARPHNHPECLSDIHRNTMAMAFLFGSFSGQNGSPCGLHPRGDV
jgi:hypothetical protein